ncbi:MAG: hypothetical protein H6550_16020 [Chitinophagales bacterium]|nr:hypothetical protein [Chitinophagales bacterium]
MNGLKCNKCDLCTVASSVCIEPKMPVTDGDRLMVIVDYPSVTDDNKGTIAASAKDELFWHIANNVCGIPNEDMYVTYAVKCGTGTAGVRPELESIEACHEYLVNEIQTIRPKAILLMGTIPAESFGFIGDIDKLAASAKDVTVGKGKTAFTTKAYITYSPSVVKSNAKLLHPFAKSIVRAYNAAMDDTQGADMTKIVMADTMDKVNKVIEYVHTTGECCFDYESPELTGLKTYEPGFRPTVLSISFQHGSAHIIPLWHYESPFSDKECMQIMEKVSTDIFANPAIRKIAQNINFDMSVSRAVGFPLFRGRLDDTMLMHHLLWDYKRHGLKDFAPDYYPEAGGYEDEVKKYGYAKAPLSVLAPYAGMDTDLTFRMCSIFEYELLQDMQQYRVYRNQVMFMLKPMWHAEHNGMLVDRKLLEQYIARAEQLLQEREDKLMSYPQVKAFTLYKQRMVDGAKIGDLQTRARTAVGKNLEKLEKRISDIKLGLVTAYEGFNMASPKQLGELLYSKEGFGFKMPYDRRKRKEHPNTDNKFLKQLGDTTGFITDLMVHRTIAKNLSTYLRAFLELLDDNDRIHTGFLLHGTRTGRASSVAPNLQNVPKHVKIDDPAVEEVVRMIMAVFKVPDGYTLLSMDLSQAELRIIAELAGDDAMIEAYNNGQDLHAVTAARLSGYSLDDFYKLPTDKQKQLRSKAKAANFGLIYGQEAKGFMEYARNNYGVDMTIEEATELRDAFFAAYPKLRDYHAEYIAKARMYGHVRTLLGRTRELVDINSDDEFLRGEAERAAINSPVQGTCGELTLLAAALIHYRVPASSMFVNTIHDNVMVLVRNEHVNYAAKLMKHTAENLPTEQYFNAKLTKLQLAADMEYSTTNWLSLKPYEAA